VNSAVTQVVVWLNGLANALGRVALFPLEFLPGWRSSTLVAVITGVLLLWAYKYTSNQKAIKRVRDDIKAQLLSLSLFKDNIGISLRAQGRIVWGALRLMGLSLVPMAVMAVPVVLLLGQLSLWYQARPARVAEAIVVTVKLGKSDSTSPTRVELAPSEAFDVKLGPVHMQSVHAVAWNLEPKVGGYHTLAFRVGEQEVRKQLAVGDGVMRVSILRPDWNWSDALMYPAEPPFSLTDDVQRIEIQYPERQGWTSGTDYWLYYWFAASIVAAFCLRGPLGVNV
jgi:uncharacterized membrane protein (DUF106 family)